MPHAGEDRFWHPERFGLAIGLEDPSAPGAAVLGIVMTARVTESGKHVIVLDAVPPFVKVFDRAGRLRAAFGRKGGGPLEVRAPAAVATMGDSALLLADVNRRLSVYDFDGNLLNQFAGIGFLPLAAAEGCDGEWVLYGPATRSAGTPVEWLHRVRFEGPGRIRVESLFPDEMPSGGIGIGKAYGLVRDGAAVTLRHEFGRVPRLVTLSCGRSDLTVVPLQDDRTPRPDAQPGEGGTRVFTVRSGNRTEAGLAFASGTPVAASLVFGGRDEPNRTEFIRLAGAEPGRARLDGIFTLRDSRPGVGVLLESPEPVPHVFLVSERDFLRLFEP